MKNRYEVRGEATAILLNRKNGEVLETLIDTADLEKVKQFPNTWCASWASSTQSYYCYGKLVMPDGQRKSILLHRWISNCPDNVQIDHFDNDTLNNRRMENLRFTLHEENHQNRSGAQRNSKSGIRGVSWHKHRRKWQALINVKGDRKFIGYFNSIYEAENAVKKARSRLMPFSKEAASL